MKPIWILTACIAILLLSLISTFYFQKKVLTNGYSDLMVLIRKRISFLLNYLISRLYRISRNINATPPVKGKFFDLAPEDGITNEAYVEALKEAIENKRVKNIGLTGPYGSGKSSILKALQAKNPHFAYITISLATFKEGQHVEEIPLKPNPAQKKPVEGEPDIAEESIDYMVATSPEKIELSILQQLFYKVKPRTLPYSRFKRIKHTSIARVMFKVFITVLTGGAIAILVWKENLFGSDSIRLIFTRRKEVFLVGATIFSVIGGCYLLFLLFRVYSNSKFSKLNLTSGELEMTTENVSVLNKHLDEILYFFEVTDFDVVIFEDLDRFSNPEIFTKLREINTLINNSDRIRRKVTFIYALRDNMFCNEPRTKFFEFIVPVIPVINAVNAREQFWKYLEQAELTQDIDPRFVRGVSVYIEDMRVLKNIVNEFKIYLSSIGLSGLNRQNLLAMIVYKNLRPTDFSDMHKGKGAVVEFIDSIAEFVKRKKGEVEEEIQVEIESLNRMKDSYVSNLDELKSVYLMKLVGTFKQFSGTVNIDGRNYELKQLLDDNIFSKLIQYDQPVRYRNDSHSYEVGATFREVQQMVNPLATFEQRKRILHEDYEFSQDVREKNIEEYSSFVKRHEQYSIKEIINLYPIIEISENASKDRLLSFLLSEGAIDEKYHYYVSYFYEGSLTRNDYEFLVAVQERRRLDYTYPLSNVKNVILELNATAFKRPEILNVALVDVVISSPSEYGEIQSSILEQLGNINDDHFNFIKIYTDLGRDVPAFMQLLGKCCKSFWKYIYHSDKIHAKEKERFFKLVITHFSMQDIPKQDDVYLINAYITAHQNFGELFESLTNKPDVCSKFVELKVKFRSVLGLTQPLVEVIHEHSLYELNREMLMLIFSSIHRDKVADLVSWRAALLTTADIIDDQKITSLIDGYYVSFASDVLAHCDNNEESEVIMTEVANSKSLELELKMEILANQKNLITDLSKVDVGLWSQLLSIEKIFPGWNNLALLFKSFQGLSEEYLAYLQLGWVEDALITQDIEGWSDSEREAYREVVKAMLESGRLSYRIYENVSRRISFGYEDLDLSKLPVDRIRLLIQSNVLLYSESYFNDLKSFGLYLDYFVHHFDAFITDGIIGKLSHDDVHSLLSSSSLTVEQKETILLKMDSQLMQEESLAAVLLDYSEKTSLASPFEILWPCFKAVPNEIEKKVELLVKYERNLSQAEIIRLLDELGHDYELIGTIRSGLVRFPKDKMHKALLSMLKRQKVIHSFSHDGEHYSITV